MQRIHLFEFNDAAWTPAPLRRTLVEFLHHLAIKLGMYEASFEIVAELAERTGTQSIQLLCAGGGGGAALLAKRLGARGRVVLSDLFPDLASYQALGAEDSRIAHVAHAVDVRDVPAEMRGIRVIVNAIHHLRPEDVRAVLQDAVAKRQPIVFIDPVQREVLPFLRFLVASPVLCVALSLGWIWPMTARRLLLGVLIPVGTACFVFDGVVSHLRAYTLDEWRHMIDHLDGAGGFTWQLLQAPSALGARINVLTGVPT